MTVGAKIKGLRKESGLSQSDLASGFFSRSYISQIERNLVKPSQNAIQHFAKVFNVSFLDLADENDFIDQKINKKLHETLELGICAFDNKDYERSILYLNRLLGFERHLSSSDVIDFYESLVMSNYWLGHYSQVQNLYTELLKNVNDLSRSEKAKILFINYMSIKTLKDVVGSETYLKLILEITATFENKKLKVGYSFKMERYYEIVILYDKMNMNQELLIVLKKMKVLYDQNGIVTDAYILSKLKGIEYEVESKNWESFYNKSQGLVELCEILEKPVLIYSSLIVAIDLLFKYGVYDELRHYLDKLFDTIGANVALFSSVEQAYYYLLEGIYYTKTREYDFAKDFFNKSRSFKLDGNKDQVVEHKIDSMIGYAELYLKMDEAESAKLYLKMANELALETNYHKKIVKLKALEIKMDRKFTA